MEPLAAPAGTGSHNSSGTSRSTIPTTTGGLPNPPKEISSKRAEGCSGRSARGWCLSGCGPPTQSTCVACLGGAAAEVLWVRPVRVVARGLTLVDGPGVFGGGEALYRPIRVDGGLGVCRPYG